MLIRFIIYGLTGWCAEIFWTGIGSLLKGNPELRGWTYLWMFPIYGMAISLEPIHNSIKEWPLIVRGGVYTLIIFLIEYISGWLLKNIIGSCPWDYSQCKFSIHGFIRLDYTPVWFAVGLLFERLHNIFLRLKI